MTELPPEDRAAIDQSISFLPWPRRDHAKAVLACAVTAAQIATGDYFRSARSGGRECTFPAPNMERYSDDHELACRDLLAKPAGGLPGLPPTSPYLG